jgi:hypothetical protein
MNACALPTLQEWEHFDRFALSLQRLGWNPTAKVDGPDARSWAFDREGASLWLVFDDMLGGSIKSEDPTVNLAAVATQIAAAPSTPPAASHWPRP